MSVSVMKSAVQVTGDRQGVVNTRTTSARNDEGVLERTREAIKEARLEAFIVVSYANVLYLSGTAFLSQRALRDRLAIVLVTVEGPPIFIIEATEAEQARDESWIPDRRAYVQFVEDPLALLASAMRERQLDSCRVGFEELSLSAQHYIDLRDLLPHVTLVAAERLLESVRSVKTPRERELLISGALATDHAMWRAFEDVRPGQSEREVGDRMIDFAREAGGVFKHLVLATGKNAWASHHFPDETRIAPGDLLRVDFGMTWNGYVSDLARTAVVAPPRSDQLDLLRRLEELHHDLIKAVQPGVRACDIYRFCVDECARRGLDFPLPHVGHGLGLSIESVHEPPVLRPTDDTEIVPGMLLVVEPMLVGRDGRYAVEDLIEVTTSGPVIRSRSRDWSEPLVLGD